MLNIVSKTDQSLEKKSLELEGQLEKVDTLVGHLRDAIFGFELMAPEQIASAHIDNAEALETNASCHTRGMKDMIKKFKNFIPGQ